MQDAEAGELERGPLGAADASRVVVTWPRSPSPLATLLRGSDFDVSRAGDPSPFSALSGARGGP
ncbi:MAG: hypothetical protein H5T73_07270 [Actinobacteria bacterium]|nr:hypothetical protein [Actinomycetota bacterium]